MGVSDLQFDSKAGPVVDLSGQGLQKLEPSFTCSEDTHTLILDRNHIMKLDYMERNPGLQQLSVAGNRLVRMMGVCRLTELRVLNLPNNSIGYIEGLRDMPYLKWLNLSGNNIKVIEQLNNCVSLQHLDLSDNTISVIGDLTKLVELKTLLLHGNSITTLRTVPAHLPAHLAILSLAENEIRDLNEVSYLAPLQELEQLSIMSNPCVMATPSLPGFDYRPYIMSWCLKLKVLDGYVVSQKEGLKAEWLYSQGKGRSFRPGQHVQLVQYLATVCPLTASPALETAEDAKLEKILSKQRFHQKQLLEEGQVGCHSPPRPTQLDVEKHSASPAPSPEGARELKKTSQSATAKSSQDTEPVVQFNTWVSCDTTHSSLPVIRSPRPGEEPLYLEDIQTDEDKLNSSMLSSESTFIPLKSDIEIPVVASDSEDETETFEPDSLAPKCPKPKKHNFKKEHHVPLTDEQSNQYLVQEVISTLDSLSSSTIRSDTPQNIVQTSSERDNVATEETEVYTNSANSDSEKTDKAAIKIQSWWRGQHTRCFNPTAKEVRSEIRLRRMQDHIQFLSEKMERVQQQYEDERLQRMVQEEAVKFLWNELQSMHQWKQSVEQQLAKISQLNQVPLLIPYEAAAPVASSTKNPPSTDVSFPDSGFQTTSDQPAAPEDSFMSSGTADSLNTVRALSPACVELVLRNDGGDSADCSLLEQYLSSVQQREEEAEEVLSDRMETPTSPLSQNTKVTEQNQPDDQRTEAKRPSSDGTLKKDSMKTQ